MTGRAFLACLAVCVVSQARAQEDSSAALPVTVKVAPAYAFSGMAFSVSGTSVPYGDAHTVAITVIRISPAPKPGSEVSATATMDKAGKFTATINHPFEWGRYRVRVTAPDHKGADTAILTLYDTPEVPDETAKALDSVVTASSKALAAAADLVAALPASPAKLRYQDSLTVAQRRVKEWATQREALKAALTVLYPVTRKTSTMLRKLVVPPGQGYNEAEGKTFAGTSPFGFIVPVEGDITGGDKLTLRFLAAQTDLSDAIAAHVVYVLIGPMILAPIVVKYDLPFQTAAFILGRAVEDKPAELAVTVTRSSMVIDHTFNRTRPGDNNKGIYMLKVHACNPSCS